MTFLKFSKEQCRRRTTAGGTICACLSVIFRRESSVRTENADGIKILANNYIGVSKIPSIKVVHESVELNLKGMAQCAMQGLK